MYTRVTPLYNHTMKSLLLRRFETIKCNGAIHDFIVKSNSDISYYKIIELFETIRFEIDRLYRLRICSMRRTLHNPYTKIIDKIFCLNVLACHYINAPRTKNLSSKITLKIIGFTILFPIHIVIHLSTLILVLLMFPLMIIEIHDPNINIENEERWAKDKLSHQKLDQDNILQNLTMRLIDISTKYEKKHTFDLILSLRTMRRCASSDTFVKVWGMNIQDMNDLESSNSGKLNIIFNNPKKGHFMFKLHNLMCKYVN